MSQESNMKVEMHEPQSLLEHPKNYRQHPPEQIAHLVNSIKVNGFYKNVVVSSDNVILAGHGVVKAARKMKAEKVPVIRMPFDSEDPRALKVVAGDNEIGRLGMVDNDGLAKILSKINDIDPKELLGTGFDEQSLSNLIESINPSEEIHESIDAMAEWVGMPDYRHEDQTAVRQIIVSFKSNEDAEAFAKLTGNKITDKTKSVWYPPVGREAAADKVYQ